MKFNCVLADPPWQQVMSGKYSKTRNTRPGELPYETMSIREIKELPVRELTTDGSHLWLWTTNAFLRQGFDVMDAWGFKYLAPVQWIKPSGTGNWFVHKTQTLLFGYKSPLKMGLGRYSSNVIFTGNPKRHSEKPEESFLLIEKISQGPRLELFSRRYRDGWVSAGNEADGMDIFESLKLFL